MSKSSTPKHETTQLAALQAQLDAATGATVNAQTPAWLTLMKAGVIVRLHIRRWRATARINLQDLGLPTPRDAGEQRVYDELMTLGAKRLLPPNILRELDSIESGARKGLSARAYKTYWGEFVPLGAYAEWKATNAEYERRYFAMRDRIKRDWKPILGQLIDAYAVAARVAYKRLVRLNPKSLDVGATRLTEDAFVEVFMARIQNAIPTQREVYDSFGFTTELSFIPLPSLLAEDAAEKERIEAQREIERVHERTALKKANEREAMLRRMNEDVVQEARQRKQQLVDGFMRDLETQALSLIYEGFVNVLERMRENNGKLVGRSALQVRNTIETWRAMNLTQNQDVEAQINRIAGMMAAPERRTVGEVQEVLRDIALTARVNLVNLGVTPRSGRTVGIPDQAEPLAVRRTKRAVQLNFEQEV